MATPPDPRLLVRCFARADEGFVEEWPVAVAAAEVRARVASTASDPQLREVLPVELASAELLVGHALPAFSEPVDFYVEPTPTGGTRSS